MCAKVEDKNVFGEPMALCCDDPVTGFYRNGFCQTGAQDFGTHVVCAEVTDEFLEFSKTRGNDLITPHPEFNFPGLKAGDKWCLCALRWTEALEAGVAPPLHLDATHERMLEFAPLDVLQKHDVKSKDQNTEKPLPQFKANAYQFSFQSIDGKVMPLSAFSDQVVLIVNTASQCGDLAP